MNQQHPDKAQWADIEKKMNSPWCTVYLKCDGYLISAGLERLDNKLVINIYVDGFIRGQWMGWFKRIEDMPEVTRKFWRHRKKSKHTAKELKLWEQLLGKRECRKKGHYDHNLISSPYWLRPRPLIRHLIKHNESIKVLTGEQYNAEMKMKEDQKEAES